MGTNSNSNSTQTQTKIRTANQCNDIEWLLCYIKNLELNLINAAIDSNPNQTQIQIQLKLEFKSNSNSNQM